MHVLIAHPDAATRARLRQAIEADGHTCELTEQGIAAFDRLRTTPFDAVVASAELPGVSGIRLVTEFRKQDPIFGYTYFMVSTADPNIEVRMRAMRAGADDCMLDPLRANDIRLKLEAAKRIGALHRQMSHQKQALKAMNRTLYTSGRTDELTGLANRRALREDLQKAWTRARATRGTIGLAMFDVDHFKLFNDHYGHVKGDTALARVAQLLQSVGRHGDRIYRYGGEEFCVLLEDESLDGLLKAADRMRIAVRAARITHEGPGAKGHITVSAGVARMAWSEDATPRLLIERADTALYAAKRLGRDQAVAWKDRLALTADAM